ncbi:MAG: MBOAT family protein [Deltaproteobacteria bacterium]|nr:MBOAT family protein [Deltaproteobacteria bacterium]
MRCIKPPREAENSTFMLFHTPTFAVFFAVVLLAYGLAGQERRYWPLRKLILLAASLIFYMAWRVEHGWILLACILISFFCAIGIEKASSPRKKLLIFTAAILGNILLLAHFKYSSFALRNAADFFDWLGFPSSSPFVEIALPIGISFYVFQALSYLIDVWKGRTPACRRVLDFALFISFFPQLIAGPILRSHQMLPQLDEPRRLRAEAFRYGLGCFAVGLIKKMLLADPLGGLADPLFAQPQLYGAQALWVGLYAYAFQIYFDFSGYTDMAIGIAWMLGFRLTKNFDHPYLAFNIRDFWRRWHITLSTWFRDYVYIPLGGSRCSESRMSANLVLTMALCGLWHGAGWMFVLWGIYHGLLLVLYRQYSRIRGKFFSALDLRRAGTILSAALTFHLVLLGWLIFRSPSPAIFRQYVGGLIKWDVAAPFPFFQAMAVVFCFIIHAAGARLPFHEQWHQVRGWLQGVGYAGLMLLLYLFSQDTERFIYFQF